MDRLIARLCGHSSAHIEMRWATVGRTQAWPREPSHPTHAPLSRTVIQAIKEKYKERGETTTPQEGHDSQRFCVHPFDGHTLRSSVTADGGGYRQQWRPGLLGKSCYFMKQCVHILFVLAFFFFFNFWVCNSPEKLVHMRGRSCIPRMLLGRCCL